MKTELKKEFLEEFTKQLILASAKQAKLEIQIEEPIAEETKKLEFHEKIKPYVLLAKSTVRTRPSVKPIAREIEPKTQPLTKHLIKPMKSIPRVPKLLPTPAINLGKLNPLISDPAIILIECNPDKNVIVRKAGRTITTGIILSPNEIENVINIFSQHTKVPLSGAIFRATLGSLTISAILSGFIGSRFIIERE